MATNAPYYQIRGEFTNAANAAFPPSADDNDYVLSGPLASSHHASLSGEHDGISHTPETHGSVAPRENHNFVELIEAATTAAGEAAEIIMSKEVESPKLAQVPTALGKRRREESPEGEDGGGVESSHGHVQRTMAPMHKRIRTDGPTDPNLHGPETGGRSTQGTSTSPPAEHLLQGARAVGVHSAAALFRPTREPARKYTRPPMSKLFMSLQLTPENFVQLQARAKAYMLDPAHPERQNCVGNRGKGDTDMVKLKLFNTVRDFLNDGVGETFFGEGVENPAEDDAIQAARALGAEQISTEGKLVWPRDGNKIISLVTPLLRRMVTNERQRMYAIETRKGGSKKKEGSVGTGSRHGSHGPQMSGVGDQGGAVQSLFHDSPVIPHLPIPHPHLPNPTSPRRLHHYPATGDIPPVSSAASPIPIPTPLSPNLDLSTHPSKIKQRPLPTPATRPFSLRKIDIFFSHNDIRLKPFDRIIGPGPLMEFSWAQLQGKIRSLVSMTLAMYPDLKPVARDEQRGTVSSLVEGSTASEQLRGLAVAVSESRALQEGTQGGEAEKGQTAQSATTDPTAQNTCSVTATLVGHCGDSYITADDISGGVSLVDNTSTVSAPDRVLNQSQRPLTQITEAPQGTGVEGHGDQESKENGQGLSPPPKVTVLSTTGLKELRCEQDWEDAKLQIGYAVWANGKVTVVVELD